MAALSTQPSSTLVRNMVASIQAAVPALSNLNEGSVLLAALEAVCAVALWLQAIGIVIAALTRAATSSGPDLDSWMADYSFSRLGAKAASGQSTFGRLTATAQAVVPVGSLIQTQDGTQQFTVILDTNNSAYSAGLGGYVLPPNTPSVAVTTQAVNTGSQGNVAAGSITSIAQAIPGIDTVTNNAAFVNGVDAESDMAFRARFVLYIAGLSKATKTAIGSAIANVQQGIQYALIENQDYNGATDYGSFQVIVDDGTGYPSTTLLSNVASAVEAVRGLGIRYGVFATSVVLANVNMTITTASGYIHTTVAANVVTALQAFINGIGLGVSLRWSQLAAVAYGVPGVTDVDAWTLNGGTSDLAASMQQSIKANTVTCG